MRSLRCSAPVLHAESFQVINHTSVALNVTVGGNFNVDVKELSRRVALP